MVRDPDRDSDDRDADARVVDERVVDRVEALVIRLDDLLEELCDDDGRPVALLVDERRVDEREPLDERRVDEGDPCARVPRLLDSAPAISRPPLRA